METRLVYRVEHAETDEGPFSFSNLGGYHDGDDFRAPWQEPRLKRRYYRGDLDGHVCGCTSLDELSRWFGPFAEKLDKAGFEVTVWRVPRRHVAYGHHQVMFRRDLAECVEQRPLADLYS